MANNPSSTGTPSNSKYQIEKLMKGATSAPFKAPPTPTDYGGPKSRFVPHLDFSQERRPDPRVMEAADALVALAKSGSGNKTEAARGRFVPHLDFSQEQWPDPRVMEAADALIALAKSGSGNKTEAARGAADK